MEIESIFEGMQKEQEFLKQKADLYIHHMLNGRKKRTYLVTVLWGSRNLTIYYKDSMDKKGSHSVNQKKFIDKVAFYSRDKGKGLK